MELSTLLEDAIKALFIGLKINVSVGVMVIISHIQLVCSAITETISMSFK